MLDRLYFKPSFYANQYYRFFTKSGTKNITFKLTISNHNLTSNIKKVKESSTYNRKLYVF
jgi:hypothetical protein